MTNYKGPPPISQDLVRGPYPAALDAAANFQFPTYAVVPQQTAKFNDVKLPALSCYHLPTDDKERKRIPLGSGVFDYFTAALIEVAKCSYQGNVQHYGNADELKWVQGKASKHFDCLLKHAADRGTFDTDGVRHTAKLAWRALAMLQMEMQEAGAPLPRSAR